MKSFFAWTSTNTETYYCSRTVIWLSKQCKHLKHNWLSFLHGWQF